jgi:YihY family inner membrane protein
MNESSPTQRLILGIMTLHPRHSLPLSRPIRLGLEARRLWAVLYLAVKKFLQIDGAQWARAFAFSAFFSLFPLMILLVTVAASFVDRASAGSALIAYVESLVPINIEMQSYIFDAVVGLVEAREQAGAVALLILAWAALQCFSTLVRVTNRAWGIERYNWWRLPLKSLMLLSITGGAVFLGMAVPVLARIGKEWLSPMNNFGSRVYALGGFLVPLLVLFLSLSLIYKLAPRRHTQFRQVWAAALCATALLQTTESLFIVFLKNFSRLHAVYGAFCVIVALLVWIYLSGCIFIFGACLCAAQAEGRSFQPETITPH